jgi:hypothetical protein
MTMITLNEQAKDTLSIAFEKIAVPYKTIAGGNEIAWLQLQPLSLKEGEGLVITMRLEMIDGELRIS